MIKIELIIYHFHLKQMLINRNKIIDNNQNTLIIFYFEFLNIKKN